MRHYLAKALCTASLLVGSHVGQTPKFIVKLLSSSVGTQDYGYSTTVEGQLWVVGDPRDVSFGQDSGAVHVAMGQLGANWTSLRPNDIVSGLGFGNAVSASGNRVAATTFLKSTYVFRYDQDQWLQEAFIPFGSGGNSLSMGAGRLAIGLPSLFGASAVVIYRLDFGADSTDPSDDTWVQEAWIPGGQKNSFGAALALDGSRLVVGAPAASAGGKKTGLAFVYEYDGVTWTLVKTLRPVGVTEEASFGASVALKGSLIVVGAPRHQPSVQGAGKGTALVYRLDPISNSWRHEASLTDPEAHSDDLFGRSVAIGDRTAFVGAYGAEAGSKQSVGAVCQYRTDRAGNSHNARAAWSLVSRITARDAAPGDAFGWSLAHGGNALLIGAPNTITGGSVYAYATK